MTETGTLPPPPIRWSLTGKRGRRSPRGDPLPPEHDVACFLLSLSSPPASPRAGDAPPEPGAGSRPAGAADGRPQKARRAASLPRSHECELCPKRFRSGRALGGHMKTHWERDLKGRTVKKKMRKISSLGPGLGLEPSSPSPPPPPLDVTGREPSSPSSPPPPLDVTGREREEEEYGGDFLEKGSSSPPSPLLLQC